MSIDIDFFHYECVVDLTFDTAYLNSKHYSEAEKKSHTFTNLSKKFRFIKSGNVLLSDRQIFTKNKVLSESVYSNPLRDFEEYEKWRKGQLRFPFFGQHKPLGIDKQEAKVASSQIKGTIGEIIAGINFEGYLNAGIVVRPIYKYPDFIGWLPNKGFAYCESKCHDSEAVKKNLDNNILNGRVPVTELKKLIADTITEFHNDEELTIFLSFSLIDSFKPAKIKHTVLELYTKKRNSLKAKAPLILIDEIVTDVFPKTIEDLSKELKNDKELANALKGEHEWKIRDDIKKKVKEIEDHANLKGKLLGSAHLDHVIRDLIDNEASKKLIEAAISGKDIYNIKLNKKEIGVKLPTVKKIKKMVWKKLGEYDDQNDVFIQYLDSQSLFSLSNKTWEIGCLKDNGVEIYVCGGALIGIFDKKNQKPNTIRLDDSRWNDIRI